MRVYVFYCAYRRRLECAPRRKRKRQKCDKYNITLTNISSIISFKPDDGDDGWMEASHGRSTWHFKERPLFSSEIVQADDNDDIP